MIMPTNLNNMPTIDDIHHLWRQKRQQVEQCYQLGMTLLQANQTKEAMPFITEAADKNLPAAQYQLGVLYEAESVITALKLYLRAAENKHPLAINACARLILNNKVTSENYSRQQLENLITSLDDANAIKGQLKSALNNKNKSDNMLKKSYRVKKEAKKKHAAPSSTALNCQQLIDSGFALEQVSQFNDAKNKFLQSLALAEQRKDKSSKIQALLYINNMLIKKLIGYPDLSLTTLMQIITLYKTEFMFMGTVNETICNTILLDSIIKKIKNLDSNKKSSSAIKKLHSLFTQDELPRYTDQTKMNQKLESALNKT